MSVMTSRLLLLSFLLSAGCATPCSCLTDPIKKNMSR